MNPIFLAFYTFIVCVLCLFAKDPVVHAYDEVSKLFAPAPIPKDPIYMDIKKEDEKRLKERNDRVAFCESKLKLVLNDEGMYNLGLKEYCQDPTEFNEKTGEPVYYFPIYKDMKAMMGKKAPTPLAPLTKVAQEALPKLGK
jgi:hypothetical protein